MPQERQALVALNGQGSLPSLHELVGSTAGLNMAAARTVYLVSLAAAQVLFQDEGEYGVRRLLGSPADLPKVTDRLDERLQQTLR